MRFELITIIFIDIQCMVFPQLLMTCELEQSTNCIIKRFQVYFPFPE